MRKVTFCILKGLFLLRLFVGCKENTNSNFSQFSQPIGKIIFTEIDYLEKALVLSDSALFDSSNFFFQKAAIQYYKKKNWKLYLKCLNEIGANYHQKGYLKHANEHLRKSLDFGLNNLGDTSTIIIQTYNYLGELAITQGQYDKADSLLNIALSANQKLLRNDNLTTAESLRINGYVSFMRSDYEQALIQVEKSLSVYKRVLGEQNKSVALCYRTLGNVYFQQQKIGLALKMYNKCLEITSKSIGQYHPDRGKIYSNLGMVYNELGNSIKAFKYYQGALSIYKRVIGEKSIFAANVYNNLGNIYEDKGDYETAIAYYTNAIAIFLDEYKNNYPMLSYVYGNIGVSFFNLGEIDKAIESYQKALEITNKVNHPIEGASIYNNLGGAYNIKGDYRKALNYCNKALNLYSSYSSREDDFQLGISSCYSNIAEIYMNQKAFIKAISYYEKALISYVRTTGRNHPHVAGVLTQLGNAWLGINNIDSAHSYYDQSIKTVLPHFIPGSLPTINDLQEVSAKNQLAGALTAKATAYRVKFNKDFSDINTLKVALDYFELAAQVIDLLRQSYKGEEAKLFLSSKTNNLYLLGLETAYTIFRHTGNLNYINKAFLFSEKGKASVLLGVTKQIGAAYKVGIPDSVLAKESSLQSEIAFYEKRITDIITKSPEDEQILQQLQVKVAKSKRQYSEFIEHIEKSYPDYYRLKYSNTVANIQEVQKYLLPNQALLEYTIADSVVYIFNVSTSHYSLVRVNTDSLAIRIENLRLALKTDNKLVFANEANALYKKLIAPYKKQLKDIQRLIIVPNGELSYVSFELLLKNKPKLHNVDYSSLSYLVKDFRISYHYSATLLLENKDKPYEKAPKSFLGLAPSFLKLSTQKRKGTVVDAESDSIEDRLPPLLGAKEEVANIAEKFGGDYYLDAAATKAQFKKQAPQYNTIHLATHALIDDEYPSKSKLAFASGGQAKEDNFLYSYELYNLKLNAELITLSACNTGIGKLQKGEGVISLARGFAYAGCPSILVSLWQASDKPTSRIMQYFYEGLYEGLTKDDALYQAKLRYLNSVDEYQANPALWGSFVLIGNSEPLHSGNFAIPPILIASFYLLLLIVGLLFLKRQLNKRMRVS